MANYHGKYLKASGSRIFLWIGIGCSVLSLVFACFLVNFFLGAVKERTVRREAIQTYMTPAPAKQEPPAVAEQNIETYPHETEAAEITEPAMVTEETTVPTEPPRFPTIDFDGLWEKNPAVVAWLEIPALEVVNYPVVLGEDNAFYVTHSWDGGSSEHGAIFLDFRNQGDFSQVHNILYGHCMKDGTMFQPLGKWEGPVFFDSHDKTAILYLPDETRVYEIFAVERVNALDARVYKPDYEADEAWQEALTETIRKAQVKSGAELSAQSEVLTFSTCIGGMTRLAVHAVCIEKVPV